MSRPPWGYYIHRNAIAVIVIPLRATKYALRWGHQPTHLGLRECKSALEIGFYVAVGGQRARLHQQNIGLSLSFTSCDGRALTCSMIGEAPFTKGSVGTR